MISNFVIKRKDALKFCFEFALQNMFAAVL